MKALTLKDPWAQLAAEGVKTFETRSWGTKYRGPLAIHSSKAFATADKAFAREFMYGLVPPHDFGFTKWPRGAVIAVCDLVDVARIVVYDRYGLPRERRPIRAGADRVTVGTEPLTDERELRCGDYRTGRWAWKLENVERIEPVKARGSLGLWNWDEKLQGDGQRT